MFVFFFFFFKQKTAYEITHSDWSSDVCSSDLNGIIIEPLGATAFPQVAKAAGTAGIGWAVLSRVADYACELRKSAHVPVFSVSTDQVEVGRIQARQAMALLPRGGSVLFIQGPSVSSVSRDRQTGFQEVLRSE